MRRLLRRDTRRNLSSIGSESRQSRMNDTEFMVSLIVGVAAPIIIATIMSWRKAHVKEEPFTGEIRLRYSRGTRAFAVFGALFIPFMLWVAYRHSGFSQEWTPITLASMFFSLFFLVLGASALIVETFGVEYRITKLGIKEHTPWSSDFLALWSDITSIGHSGLGIGMSSRRRGGRCGSTRSSWTVSQISDTRSNRTFRGRSL